MLKIFAQFNFFQAAKRACEILLERLKPIRAENPTAKWSTLIEKAFENYVDLSATYMYKPSDIKEYDVFGAACCEVEVDLLTGNIQLRRVDIVEDVGESMSPGIDVGQIEGAFVMGLGYWFYERLIHNQETGELLTNRTWNYKPPGAKDIPIDFRVTFLHKSSNPFGVLRSKGKKKKFRIFYFLFNHLVLLATGEPALCLSIVALFALRHALDSARRDSGIESEDDFYHLGAPTTAEQIFFSANNQMEQYLLD